MKAIRNIIIMTFAVLPMLSYSQQDAQFSQYMFNHLFYNPATAGEEAVSRFSLIARSQWTGLSTSLDGARVNPNTQILSASLPFFMINGGVGFHIVNDNLGPQNNLEAQFSTSYFYQSGSTQIGFGLRAGIFSQTIDFDKYRAFHPDDPLILNRNGKESQIRPDMAAGIVVRTQDLFVGVSINHIVKSEFDFGISGQKPLEKNLNITAEYNIPLSALINLKPSFFVKSDFNSYSFDVGILANYKDKMYSGLSFRQSEAIVVLLGCSFFKDNSVQIGYSFDMTIKAVSAKKFGSHELRLCYQLPMVRTAQKVTRSPRFIF